MRVGAGFRHRSWGWWPAALWLTLLGLATLYAAFFDLKIKQQLRDRLQVPSLSHPFGTNGQGKDVLKLMIDGAATTLLIGVCATLLGLVFGSLFGLLLGYWRGRIDQVGTVVLDALAAFPTIVAVIAAVLFFGNSVQMVILIIGVLTIPIFTRIMRAITLQIVERDFIKASRTLGARHSRVIFYELVPNVAVPVMGYAVITVGLVVAIEGALSLFGLGVPDNVNTWGKVIQAGVGVSERAPHLALVAAGVVFVTVLSLNKLSEDWTSRWGSFGLSAAGARQPPLPDVAVPFEPSAPRLATRTRSDATVDDAPLLSISNLHTWLSTPFGAVRAVDGVSLAVGRGKMLALVGESGSGKTMLARSILGLVPSPLRRTDVPGSIVYRGTELCNATEETLQQYRGRRIAMVFQDPLTQLNPVLRVGTQIAEPLEVHLGMPKSAARARAVELLAEVGVNDPQRRARQYASELSGGLRQRVAIAIALSANPAVLILDEPTSALDVTVQAQILDLIDRLRATRGLGVLFITHDLGLVASRADEVAVMYGGRIVEQGTTANVFRSPRHPYTAALLGAVPRLDGVGHQRLASLPGSPPLLIGPRSGCSFAARCESAQPECTAAIPLLDDGPHQVACFFPRSQVPQPQLGH